MSFALQSSAQTLVQAFHAVAPDATAADRFGCSVAISGNYAIIGANLEAHDAVGLNPLNSSGSAYIFKKTETGWQFQQKIVANDRAANDQFGYSVAISGEFAIVGAQFEDQDAAGSNTVSNAGSAYVFKLDNNGVWTQQQKLIANHRGIDDNFGFSVAIEGNIIVVGAYREDQDVNELNSKTNSGSAYVYKFDGTNWEQINKLVATDRSEESQFGYTVAINGDNIIIGAPLDKLDVDGLNTLNSAGSVYLFKHVSCNNWLQQQKITAADRAMDMKFGVSVAIDGNYLVVGADGNATNTAGAGAMATSGAAYVFNLNQVSWVQQKKLIASDRAIGDAFGISVAINGDHILVGSYLEDEDVNGSNMLSASGSAYFFKRSSNDWAQTQKVTAATRGGGVRFGYSVSLGNDEALIGAYLESGSAGAAYVYSLAVVTPVKLVNYTGSLRKDGTVELHWETETETNNDYFSVESSADGENYTQLSKIKTKGASGFYVTRDLYPLTGINYYRLSQTDYNGEISQLGMVPINVKALVKPLQIFPNPVTSSEVNIVESKFEGPVKISVYTTTGQLAATDVVTFKNGRAKYHLPVSISKGIYVINVGSQLNNKLIIQ